MTPKENISVEENSQQEDFKISDATETEEIESEAKHTAENDHADRIQDMQPFEKDYPSAEQDDQEETDSSSKSEDSEQHSAAVEKSENEQSAGTTSSDIAEFQDDEKTFRYTVRPYNERYYLKYHEGKRTTPLELKATKEFLQQIGFDGGELRQAREGKNYAENLRNTDKSKSNQAYCSYCGTEISGVEFYRLPDGRMRCNTCNNTIVKSKSDVEAIYKRVVSNMESFFGATMDVPISIEIVDEKKLKKKAGVSLDSPDAQSILILGVAINKRGKYSIVLENGAPRISLIATFAHESTHIWQYTHWDNNKQLKKCSKSKRLLIYEGMAKWVEIQYLYLIGETTVAQREEHITRNRKDEYGIGFRLYDEKYPLSRESMTCEETPFTPNSYPF